MDTTKQAVEQITELNELLSQGKMKDQPKTLEFIGGMVANRCYQDAAFAKEFRDNPEAAVRKMISDAGVQLSDKIKITPCENDATVWNLPIPSEATLNKVRKGSLSDAQMAQVSGGEILIAALAIGTTATAVGIGVAGGVVAHKNKKKKGKK